jgi:hypothetical protein
MEAQVGQAPRIRNLNSRTRFLIALFYGVST